MPEPTDHRAEAEKWLGRADSTGLTSEALKAALIGIGHALLADPPERTTTVNAANYAPDLIRFVRRVAAESTAVAGVDRETARRLNVIRDDARRALIAHVTDASQTQQTNPVSDVGNPGPVPPVSPSEG